MGGSKRTLVSTLPKEIGAVTVTVNAKDNDGGWQRKRNDVNAIRRTKLCAAEHLACRTGAATRFTAGPAPLSAAPAQEMDIRRQQNVPVPCHQGQ